MADATTLRHGLHVGVIEDSRSLCFPPTKFRAYPLAGTARSARGARPWVTRSLAGSRYVTRVPAGTTFTDSYAIVAARMRSHVALQR